MTEDILALAKSIQRKEALQTSVWVRLALIEDMIAEIERLRQQQPVAKIADIVMKHREHLKPSVKPTELAKRADPGED